MEEKFTTQQRAFEQFQAFLSDCNIENYQGKKILEVGFWEGFFVNECSKAGLSVIGLEINKEYVEMVKKEYPHLDLRWYDGGKFPAPDNYFDFVVSFQVLEHTNSPEHIIKECLRVLKDGGIMYHVCPNYHSFYEGHYNIFWLPFLNKNTARIYLKLLGRYTPYFEGLNTIKPKYIINIFKKYQNELEVISLGKREFVRKFSPEQIEKVNQRFLKKCLKMLNAVPIIKKNFLWAVCAVGFYYPITIISRKKASLQEKQSD